MFGYCSNSFLGGRPATTTRTLEEVKQLASQRGCEVLEVETKEGKCIILFDDWFIDGKITRYENNHYGYEDACQWLEQFACREELIGMAVDEDALPSDMLPF